MRGSQRLLRFAIGVLGVASIVATGGGGGGTNCGFACPPDIFPSGPSFNTLISPAHQTVQVGMPATFRATTDVDHPTFKWCRRLSGQACTSIGETSEPIFTLPAVSLADDSAQFQVVATGSGGSATSGFASISVSPLPAVVFEDGEFVEAGWQATSLVFPPQGGPTFSVARVPSGGNPGAFRNVTYDMPASGGSVRVFHTSLAATYVPSSQGAIKLLEFAMDCSLPSSNPAGYATSLLIVQGDRRFVSRNFASNVAGVPCSQAAWAGATVEGIAAGDFALLDGPACVAGQACPDFTATAEPLRFGVATAISRSPAPQGRTDFGIDNWKVTVWRR